MTSTLRISLLVAASTLGNAAAGRAQTTGSSAAPSYTAAQAKSGETAYNAACLACHRSDLSGDGEAPTLAGPTFARRWDGRPVTELARFMREHMPRTMPGALNDRTYLALVAYLLAKNGVPTGKAPLTFEAPEAILIASP